MGFILFIISVALSIVLYPIAFIVSIVTNFWKTKFREGVRKLNQQFTSIAVSIDATGNVVCDDLFNVALIKKSGYKFGERKETVSSVLGKNQLIGTLSFTGKVLAGLLDLLDKDHCFKSIDQRV